MSFCGNFNFRNQVENLIYNGLFNVSANSTISFKAILKDWYEKAICLRTADNNAWMSASMPFDTAIKIGRQKDALLDVDKSVFLPNNIISNLLQKGYTHIGHDTPVWIIPDSVNENLWDTLRIMIISQDPRRDLVGNGVLLSTPFGLHCQAYYDGKIETRIADRLHKMQKNGKHISLYFTDAYKLFVEDSQNDKSKSTSLLNEYNDIFKCILDKEIELFKPNLIVCWGRESANLLLEENIGFFNAGVYNGGKVLPVCHTSGLAAGCRKEIRERLNYENDEDMYVTEIYNAL